MAASVAAQLSKEKDLEVETARGGLGEMYRGPWRKVIDDDGHVLERGKRMAVCDKTFRLYNREPYEPDILPIEPYESISLEAAPAFDCSRTAERDPRETKGNDFELTDLSGQVGCEPATNCC